jgi:short-subunit dehydrogenase
MRRTALVTRASAGIGSEFARELASDGFDLVLVARRRERLEQLAAELGAKTCVLAEDLSDPAAPQRIFSTLKREAVHLDMLVNNAGAGIAGVFVETAWREHPQLIQVQVAAAAQLTHLFLPAMLERGYGRIIQSLRSRRSCRASRAARYIQRRRRSWFVSPSRWLPSCGVPECMCALSVRASRCQSFTT